MEDQNILYFASITAGNVVADSQRREFPKGKEECRMGRDCKSIKAQRDEQRNHSGRHQGNQSRSQWEGFWQNRDGVPELKSDTGATLLGNK